MARNNIFTQIGDAISTSKANKQERRANNLNEENIRRAAKGKKPITRAHAAKRRRNRIVTAGVLAVALVTAGQIIYSQSDAAQEKRNEKHRKEAEAVQKRQHDFEQTRKFRENAYSYTDHPDLTPEQRVARDTIDVKPVIRETTPKSEDVRKLQQNAGRGLLKPKK